MSFIVTRFGGGTSRSAATSPSLPASRCTIRYSTASATPIPNTADPPTLSVPKKPKEPALADALFHHLVNTQRARHDTGSEHDLDQPTVVRAVSPRTWKYFKKNYGESANLACARFEYDPIRQKVIVLPLPAPFHDVAPTIMADQVKMRMLLASLDTVRRIMSLKVNRENFEKSSATGLSQREPDCGLWTTDYADGIVPTMVWEIGHSQHLGSLLRRAKMWARRYNGGVQAIILLKYTARDPRLNPASYLLLFRPQLREDGKWTAVQDGPTYTVFPRPPDVVPDQLDQQGDVLPLMYQDYFGPGNVRLGTDPRSRFDLPLELVRIHIQDAIVVAGKRRAYRYVSGGSSIAGVRPDVAVVDEEEEVLSREVVEDREESPDEEAEPEFAMFGEDWDDAMSDISDA